MKKQNQVFNNYEMAQPEEAVPFGESLSQIMAVSRQNLYNASNSRNIISSLNDAYVNSAINLKRDSKSQISDQNSSIK